MMLVALSERRPRLPHTLANESPLLFSDLYQVLEPKMLIKVAVQLTC